MQTKQKRKMLLIKILIKKHINMTKKHRKKQAKDIA
jgi:hypothetical protein